MVLEKSVAIIFLILGLSLFFKGESWKSTVIKLNNSALYPPLGMLCLSLGSFLIVFLLDNWDYWMESHRPIILLIMGFLALLKAFFLLFLPKYTKAFFDWALRKHQALYRLEAVFYIIIAIALFI